MKKQSNPPPTGSKPPAPRAPPSTRTGIPPKTESWGTKFMRLWGSDTANLESYNPCGYGYQPYPRSGSLKLPPTSREAPPMPDVKPPKDEDYNAPKDMIEFINQQISRYERVYMAAISQGFVPDDAKAHADNVINQVASLYIYHTIQNEVDGE
jgi:hypothetical protein